MNLKGIKKIPTENKSIIYIFFSQIKKGALQIILRALAMLTTLIHIYMTLHSEESSNALNSSGSLLKIIGLVTFPIVSICNLSFFLLALKGQTQFAMPLLYLSSLVLCVFLPLGLIFSDNAICQYCKEKVSGFMSFILEIFKKVFSCKRSNQIHPILE